MSVRDQIALCSEHYRRWKDIATSDGSKAKNAMEKAFFWLKLQTAFITLYALERSKNDTRTKRKLIIAKTNLSRKLADYANEVLSEII